MSEQCELLEQCAFFEKYQSTWNMACKNLISNYCKGSKMGECKRKAYRKEHGKPPSPDMMPSGQIMSSR